MLRSWESKGSLVERLPPAVLDEFSHPVGEDSSAGLAQGLAISGILRQDIRSHFVGAGYWRGIPAERPMLQRAPDGDLDAIARCIGTVAFTSRGER